MAMTVEERKEYNRKYYAENKERFKEYNRRYYAQNKEKDREWKKANPDKIAEYRRKYSEKRRKDNAANPEKASARWHELYLKHREKKAKSRREWKKANPDKVAEYQQRYEIGTRYPPELVEVKIMQLKIQALLRTGETT